MHWIFHVESSPLSYSRTMMMTMMFRILVFAVFSRRCVMDSITSATNERRPCHHHLAYIFLFHFSFLAKNLSSSTLMTVAASKLIMNFFVVRFLFRILAESKTEVRGGHVSVDLSADACLKFVNSSCVCFFSYICHVNSNYRWFVAPLDGPARAHCISLFSPDLPRWGLVAINRRVLYKFS